MVNDYLEHYGVPGMKWGVRRYQNYDGTRIKSSDSMTLKKGTTITRYTANPNERKDTYKKYASTTKWDTNVYKLDAINNKLGFKSHDSISTIKIKTMDDANVMRGKSSVKYVLDKIGDKSVNKAFDELDKAGFYDENKSVFDRYKIWSSDEHLSSDRKKTAKAIHEYMYSSGNKELDELAKKGYDAIVDPEDFTYNYEMPLILLNNNKFVETGRSVIQNEDWYKRKIEGSAKKKLA